MNSDERCCVCSVPLTFFVPSARNAHVNACLDAEDCAADPLPAEDDVTCSVCARNLVSLSKSARELHVNRCLDKTLPPTTRSRENGRESLMANGSSPVASRRGRCVPKKGNGPELCGKMKILLEMLGLERYEKRFAAQEIDIEALQLLEDGDWTELGLPEGAQRRITDAARHARLLELQESAVTNRASRALEKTHEFRIDVDGDKDDSSDDADGVRRNGNGGGCNALEFPALTQPLRTSSLGATMARRKGHLLAGMAGRLHAADDDEADVHYSGYGGLGDGVDDSGNGQADSKGVYKLHATSSGPETQALERPEIRARDSGTGTKSYGLESGDASKLLDGRGYTQLECLLEEIDADHSDGANECTRKYPAEDCEPFTARLMPISSTDRSIAVQPEEGTSSARTENCRKDTGGAFSRRKPAEVRHEAIEVIEISPEPVVPQVSPREKDDLPSRQLDLEPLSDRLSADGVDGSKQHCRNELRAQNSVKTYDRGKNNSALFDSGPEAALDSSGSKTHHGAPHESLCGEEDAIVCSVDMLSPRAENGVLLREGTESDNASHAGVLELAGSYEDTVSSPKRRLSVRSHPIDRSADDISRCADALSRTSNDAAVLERPGFDRNARFLDQERASLDDSVAVRRSERCPYNTEAEVNRWFNERRNDEIRRHRAMLERLESERQLACEAAVDYEGQKSSSLGLLGKRKGTCVLDSAKCAETLEEPENSADESSGSVLDLTQRGGCSEGDEDVAEIENIVPSEIAVGQETARQNSATMKKKSKKEANAPRRPPASDQDLVSIIRANYELYDKILVVEPVALEAVVAIVKQAGFRISVANLAAFLDRQGVNYKVVVKESTEDQRDYMKHLNSQM